MTHDPWSLAQLAVNAMAQQWCIGLLIDFTVMSAVFYIGVKITRAIHTLVSVGQFGRIQEELEAEKPKGRPVDQPVTVTLNGDGELVLDDDTQPLKRKRKNGEDLFHGNN